VFREKLKALGWIEGQNLVIESALANYKADQLPALAEGLVRKRVEIIWALSGGAAVAATRATKTIPIVFVAVPWPVETGLIDSFARPGRNVTGVSSYSGIEVSTKRLEFLKEIAPTATRLSWILDADMAATVDGGSFDARPLLDSAARRLGYEVRYHTVATSEHLDPAFADILKWRAQAIAVAGSATTFAARERIADFALRSGLPSSCASSSLVDAGGLFSYNAAGDLKDSIARSVEYVDRLFRGARPADLPVSRPDKYEFVINLKTAKALGLNIPHSMQLRADRVIQ
jgi:putative ABC transport system substrate-binding protein